MYKYYYFGLKQHREKQYAFRSYFLYRSNPYKVNEAILVFGDVHGQVNALLFSAATMALFDRPSQPAGSKQGIHCQVLLERFSYVLEILFR